MACALLESVSMIPSSPPSAEREPLRLERLLGVLPDSDALRPLVEELFATSRADPGRRWTASGELGTAGSRLVDAEAFAERARAWIEIERHRSERRVARLVAVVSALQGGDHDRLIDVLLEESSALEAEGYGAEAGRWADAAHRIARESGHPRSAEALRKRARCDRAAGALDVSARAYEEAFSRAQDAGRWNDAVVAATGRGNVAVDQGRWGEAEKWYERALAVLDGSAVPPPAADEARGLRWRLCQNLGITHRERGALAEADEWYGRAEAAASGLGDLAASIEIENGRGQLDLAKGEARSAELRFRRAIEAMQGDAASGVRVAIRTNLGQALFERGHALDAAQAAREAEAEALRGRHLGRLPAVYRLLGRISHARGEDEAFVLVDRALEIVRSAELPSLEEALTLEVYADLREAQGESEAAAVARENAADIFRRLGADPPAARHDERENDPGGGAR